MHMYIYIYIYLSIYLLLHCQTAQLPEITAIEMGRKWKIQPANIIVDHSGRFDHSFYGQIMGYEWI